MLKRLIVVGIVSGGIFGLFLRIVEHFTDKKVYTLLLNVDYFPLLKHWDLYEVIEFSLHLVVSIIVVIVIYYGLKKIGREKQLYAYVWINLIIGGFLYLTTTFSERTPELTDMTAFCYWVVGHIVFGALVGIMIRISR